MLRPSPNLVKADFRTDFTAPGELLSVNDAFERAHGQLLIVGEPGSGKTTLALELLKKLLDRASADPEAPVPELFTLGLWARRPRTLMEWLEDELRVRGFSPDWVRSKRLVPILDGLDEVDEQHRAACLQEINTFREFLEGGPLVVTCRRVEYEALISHNPELKLALGGA